MSRSAWLIALFAASLLIAAVPAATASSGSVAQQTGAAVVQDVDKAPVDDKVTNEREVVETTRLVVEFADRPDLRPAAAIEDFAARGQFVVDELQDTAVRSQRAAQDLVSRHGGSSESFWFRNVMIVEGDAELLEALAALPGVKDVRPERIYPLVRPVEQGEPIEVNAGDPEWGIAQIAADLVWDEGVLGGGVVIANVDTGVDYSHEALVNQYRGNVGNGTFSHDYNWWDPTGICGDEPCDNVDHGTHTMGTMVGGDGPGPFTPDIGVAPGAHWIAAKGCEDLGCSEFALLSAGQWILAPTDLNGENPDPAKRPDIVNNSWGGGPGDEFYRETVENWRAAGIIPVFSTGNPGPFCGEGGSPGDFNETFSVGATDIDDVIADFSGRGPSVYGKVNPDVAAPGVDVVSSVPGDGYAAFSGTSMAAPHAAGTLALVLSSTPDLFADFDGATSPVRTTAIDIIDTSCGGDDDGDPNNVYGEGRIDAFAAVQLVATGGTLSGVVTDLATGDGIPASRIIASAESRDYAGTAGPDGAYSMFLPAGIYTVTASAFAYTTALATGVVVETDLTTVQAFALDPLPSATVTGRVFAAESRRPIASAQVVAVGTPVAAAVTNADGVYSLTLPIGVYTLEASKGGCMSTDQLEIELSSDLAKRNLSLAQRIDDFGYGCELIDYSWVDAQRPTTVYGDDQTGRLPMPFDFPFYGDTYEQLFIATNGYVAFQDESLGFSDFYSRPIPDRPEPNAAIYALWQDLWVIDAAHVDWDHQSVDGENVLVVEYAGVPNLGSSNGADFEVKLWEDGTIDLLYGADIGAVGSGGSATVGIENATGTDALMYSYHAPVLEPESALRFREFPTGLVTGTVTNLNDGLGVPGATVTASPSGRTATTGEGGDYSLKLLPGSYVLTFEAPGYDDVTRPVKVRADMVFTVDAALPAPVAMVDPATIEATAEPGETATVTMSVGNAGSGVLTWEIFERETGVAPPDLPPATTTVAWSTSGEPPSVPKGFQPDLRAWPTFEGPLQSIITDPAGDAGGAVDVIGVKAGADELEVSFELVYSADTPMDMIENFVFLDTDQDPSSGLPPEALFGLPTQDIGMEYFVDVWAYEDELFGFVVDAETFNLVAEIGVETDGQTFRFDIPLEVLGGDDGAMDVAVASFDPSVGEFDWAPDSGHGTVLPFRDAPWMSAEPDAGAALPGETTAVTVALGGEEFGPAEYTAVLAIVTNDPRQSVHEVAVTFTVGLPDTYGSLEGIVTNARAGFPVPAKVTLEAVEGGIPAPVVVDALDTDGSYLLFAPEGTWPMSVEFGGYATWEGEATITAGAAETLDVALAPLWPFPTLEGGPINVELAEGEVAETELTLGNVEGLAALEFEFLELDLGGAEATAAAQVARPDLDASAPSNDPPKGYEAAVVERRVTNGAEAVVFMDALPWESDALLQVLDANSVGYDVATSGDMDTLDLAPYQVVFVSNDQPQAFYDAYEANAGRFEDYVAGGGFLWFGAAASGWNEGFIGEAPLPGGVTVIPDVFEGSNDVVVPDHPVMAGVPSPFFGEAASHSAFDGAAGESVIASGSDSELPTLLDYEYGLGRVLAIGQTLEFSWMYGGDVGIILENAVPYAMAFQPFSDVPWLSADPATGTVDAGDSVIVVVAVDATGLEPGQYDAQLVAVTNDPLIARLTTQVTLTVTG